MFCNLCKCLTWTEKDGGGSYPHQPTYDALVESASDGCTTCAVFLKAVHLHYDQYHPEPTKDVSQYHRDLDKTPHSAMPFQIQKVLVGVDDKHGEPPLHYETRGLVAFTVTRPPRYRPYEVYQTCARVAVMSQPDTEPLRYWQIFGRPPSTSPDLALAKAWLEECLQFHPKCLRPRTTIHPPRLLDLDSTDGTSDLRLKTHPMDRGHYATLSHCWGRSQPLRLLQTNLEDFKKSIPFSQLPKTFQDAVTATRTLGLRYLWIDSLCILQDSASDWEVHCTEMANIYKRSYVTLAGPLSSNCDAGFLHAREQLGEPVTIKLDDEGEEVEVTLGYHNLEGSSYCYAPEPDSPLSKRAWVLQERILSGRTLYFGKSRMYLECHTNTHFEDCHWPVQWDEKEVGGMVVKRPIQDIYPASTTTFKYWYSLVSTYSALNLTKETDKLPALSGMASLFGQILGDTYVAGHWREDLPRSLIWVVSPENKPGSDIATAATAQGPYIAPTWSWASSPWKVNIPIKAGYPFSGNLDIHEISVTPAGKDERGMVQEGGYMDVSGLVLRGVVKRTGPRTADFRSGRFTTDAIEWDWDDRGDGLGGGEGSEFDVHLLEIGWCDYHFWMIIQPAPDTSGVDCWRRIGMTAHFGRDFNLHDVRRTEKEHKRLRLV